MRISILSIGAIASVLTINAYATSSTVTSKDYVDNELAQKQAIITPTNYSATIGNTTYPVKGLVLYPDANNSDASGAIGANKLFGPDMAFALANYADSNPNNDDTNTYWYNEYLWPFEQGETCSGGGCDGFTPGFANYVITGAALFEGLNRLRMRVEDMIYAAKPTGDANTVALYGNDGELNTSRALYDGSGTYNAGTDAGKIATAAAVDTRQAKKTCAGWMDGTTTPDATHTDANCVLWNLPD